MEKEREREWRKKGRSLNDIVGAHISTHSIHTIYTIHSHLHTAHAIHPCPHNVHNPLIFTRNALLSTQSPLLSPPPTSCDVHGDGGDDDVTTQFGFDDFVNVIRIFIGIFSTVLDFFGPEFDFSTIACRDIITDE